MAHPKPKTQRLTQPETMTSPDINWYRLQCWYQATEWYAETEGKKQPYLKLTALKGKFRPTDQEVRHRWLELHRDQPHYASIPTSRSKQLSQIRARVATNSGDVSSVSYPYRLPPMTLSVAPGKPQLTSFFYFDADIPYLLQRYAGQLKLDSETPVSFDTKTNTIRWNLISPDSDNLVYQNAHTDSIGCRYRLTIYIPIVIGDHTLLVVTDSTRFVTISEDGKDILHLSRPALSQALRGALLRAALYRNPTLTKYWQEYWRVTESRERWTYTILHLIRQHNERVGIDTRHLPYYVEEYVSNYLADHPDSLEAPTPESGVVKRLGKMYHAYHEFQSFRTRLLGSEDSNLLDSIPAYLLDASRREWCLPSKSQNPHCLVPLLPDPCGQTTSPPRRFGLVPASQYSRYGNDACLPMGKETYGYRSVPQLQPFPYYYDAEKYPDSYQKIREMLQLPRVDWGISQTQTPDDTFHPLQLTLNQRQVPFQFPTTVLQRLRVYVLDYETSGTILGSNHTPLERLTQQLTGDHSFRVNSKELPYPCENIRLVDLRRVTYSYHEDGVCHTSTLEWDGSTITRDGTVTAQIVNENTIHTTDYHYQRHSDQIIRVHPKNPSDTKIVAQYQSGNKGTASIHPSSTSIPSAIVTWYLDPETPVTTSLLQTNKKDYGSNKYSLHHQVRGETVIVPTTGLQYFYHLSSGEIRAGHKYRLKHHHSPDSWLLEWFKNFVWYYQTLLAPHLAEPFRTARQSYQAVPTQLGILDVSPLSAGESFPVRSESSEYPPGFCGSLRDLATGEFHPVSHQTRHYYRTFAPSSWENCPWISISYRTHSGDVRDIEYYQGCDAVHITGLDDRALVTHPPFTKGDMVKLDQFLRAPLPPTRPSG